MKLKNGYWKDQNGNLWNAIVYTKEVAAFYSLTLINCFDCIGCKYLLNCSNVVNPY